MQIRARCYPADKIITIDVEPQYTIEMLKAKIEEEMGDKAEVERIIYLGELSHTTENYERTSNLI
ncbi:unnamed protein product [Anisakis simplex]|uniref:Ubiquitin-like domain-containing protein n=1 Tax=Anisakis simplex TaxID=6269 RepID=A0A0M3JGT9_ANISI|nr:unnamed protein product [Anisakis simplex]VDK27403.1 unnamed protein product [Anisakis simplex]